MQAIIHTSSLEGTLQAPASKSSMQRACAAALLSKHPCTLKNPGHSDDDKAALNVLSVLGCETTIVNGELIIDPRSS
ncbi:MAG TPA: hypothetical protein VNV85_04000, partial [Puia sp.]|nr:hypothetical protein [Puia sp.]